MDTLPSVAVQQNPPPPPPPAVERRSVSVGTDVDLEVLYTPEIAPGILRATLPWGLTIKDIVQALIDHPTLHVDDLLREMLLHPHYPGTTMRDFQALYDSQDGPGRITVGGAAVRHVYVASETHLGPE